MSNELQNKTVAMLATERFEYVELTKPKQALEAAGAKTRPISAKEGEIRAWDLDKWGDDVSVDVSLDSAMPDATMRCYYLAASLIRTSCGRSRRQFNL